ncbi:formin-like protein 18 [Prosopis cineraria]|uniref:formin-like protein 18 n=1 Tax=Prosopis cineraria TaxID=364024 RepID=UPI00240F8962|nr:formin-like protein 18 [Prosopis cineraria]
MTLLRKLFFRKPPDGLLEICERVYVFDCCFTTDAWNEENYKVYMDGIVAQLREYLPDASILVFNFRQEETKSQMANILSEYDMTIMDYPRQYEGCPVLKMEVIHHFLRSSESWLSLGQHNVLLMHCERGGWPVLAFMLAALLIYRKHYSGEQRTLDMVYRQAPRELLQFLSPLNPIPSQLRYLQYISRRNVAINWPPLDRALTLDCIILRCIPDFDGEGGCCPVFRIYGQDPFLADKTPKILYSTQKKNKTLRFYKQGECELIKIDINCHIQGDVVIESINLTSDMDHERMMFRVMFNTAFIRSNILMLNRDEVDILWDAKDLIPKDFRAEILFSEMDAAAAVIADGTSCFEEKEGLPVEAFAKVQEIFNHVDWLNPKADVALNVLQQLSASVHDTMDKISTQQHDTGYLLHEEDLEVPQVKQNEVKRLLPLNNESLDSDLSKKVDKPIKTGVSPLLRRSSDIICQKMPITSMRTSESSKHVTSSTNLDVNTLVDDLALSSSVDTSSESLSPKTPPQHPSLISKSKNVHDTPPNTQLPPLLSPLGPCYPVTGEIDAQSQDRSESSIFSSTSGASLSSTFPNKVPPDAASHPSASLMTSTLPSPSPTTSLKEILLVRTKPASSTSCPPTPPTPPTPPQKEHKLVRAVPPPPPPPPQKEQSLVGAMPPPLPLREESHNQLGPPPLKEEPKVKTGPPPLPPLPPKVEPPVSVKPPPPPPPPPRLPGKSDSTTVSPPPPPPPPPPPRLPGKSSSTTVSPPPPPPPPAAALSSKHLNPSLQNSTSVPAAPNAPPPPVPFSKGDLKSGNGFLGYASIGGDGNIVSSTTGPRGRILSRTISSMKNQNKKLKPLHWLKLSRAVQGSLWHEAAKSGEASKAPEIDISELESLFSAAVPSSAPTKKVGVRSSAGPKSDKVQLVEHRRAYNCEIMLSKVKVPLHDLMSSVLALEDSALDIDQVENLIKFCPTKEEMELLKGYTGEKEKLGRCEQFFLELMKVPRVESKLRVFSFKIQFHSQVSDLRKSLNIVDATVEEIKNSVKLKRIMQTILSLGNALNQGTARGSAIGFRLDSLLKLTEMRARNNKMTLMHYLCKVLADKLPEVLDFSKDLANLEPAAKIQLKFLAEEMQAISKGLEKVIQELSTSENDGPISETFRKTLKDFLRFAEAEVRSLASLYSGVGRKVDALIVYFGEDPSRCPFEQVVSTLLNFTRMFNKANEENCKQLEFEMKKSSDNEKKICESQRILPTAIRTGNVK